MTNATLTQDERAQFTDRIEERVAETAKTFQGMELEQMRKGEIEARAKLAEAKADFDQKRAAAEKRLKRARKASSDAWDDTRKGLESAWDELSTSLEDARERFAEEGSATA